MSSRAAINRELSWLEFNRRVLGEALDDSNPLLERLNFLAITASNLDEFFMVRVGGLELLRDNQVDTVDASGLTLAAQLKRVRAACREMASAQYRCFREQLGPALAREGIGLADLARLTPEQARHVERYFREDMFPVFTPMRVDAAEFPALPNLGLNVLVRFKPAEGDSRPAYAVVPLGRPATRFVPLPGGELFRCVPVESLVHRFLDLYFPGKPVAEAATFRITRNADFVLHEELATDFLQEMEEAVSRRKEGMCVRLELDRPVSKTLMGFLERALKLTADRVGQARGPLDLAAFREFTGIEGIPRLKFEPWPPQPSPDIDPRNSMFDEIRKKDILLSHPYDSFDPVIRFVQDAADDPGVLAIKQTLYRLSRNSPVVAALRQAAERGKNVTALVELKARFDEESNIEWARALERAGVQVIYGVKNLKTHAKLCVVVRREPRGLARYVHLGTGNYNERTARQYADVGLFTCDPDLGSDASAFFNAISGYSEPPRFLKLFAAPIGLKEKLLAFIAGEAQRSREGRPAGIAAKLNSLVDADLIKALYKASQAGVRVRLCVRGICCLRPGVKGLSESIAVVSIVDRFLEHSRIFHFCEGGADRVFISSADWMPRNLERRVELMAPVEDAACKQRLLALLENCFRDDVRAWRLEADGSYTRLGDGKRKGFRLQEALYKEACLRAQRAGAAVPRVFEPHKPPGTEV